MKPRMHFNLKGNTVFRSLKNMNSRNAVQKFRARDFESAKDLSIRLSNNKLISMPDARASHKSTININNSRKVRLSKRRSRMSTVNKTNVDNNTGPNYADLVAAAHDTDVSASLVDLPHGMDLIKSGEAFTRNESDLDLRHHSMPAGADMYEVSRGSHSKKHMMIMASIVPIMNSSSSGDLRPGASLGGSQAAYADGKANSNR